MKERIYGILETVRPEVDFRTKEDFFDDGFRDSIEFMRFLTQLDAEFGIDIDGIDMLPENFSNIDSIVDLLGRYGVR